MPVARARDGQQRIRLGQHHIGAVGRLSGQFRRQIAPLPQRPCHGIQLLRLQQLCGQRRVPHCDACHSRAADFIAQCLQLCGARALCTAATGVLTDAWDGHNMRCACQAGYVPRLPGVPVSALGNPCVGCIDADCGPNAACAVTATCSTCQCNAGYTSQSVDVHGGAAPDGLHCHAYSAGPGMRR